MVGFRHQAGAKPAFLHLFTGATHVQVDLVVAPVGCQLGRFCQEGRIVTTHLQGEGTFDRIKANQPLQPAPRLAGFGLFAGMVQGLRHHHFGVQEAVPGDLPHQHPEVPIGVVHHRSHTEAITGLAVLLHPPMLPSRVP